MLLAILVVIPYLGLIGVKMWYDHKVDKIANAKFIIVDNFPSLLSNWIVHVNNASIIESMPELLSI